MGTRKSQSSVLLDAEDKASHALALDLGSSFAVARAGLKCPQERAHDAREFVARTWMCVQRTPACPREPPQAARHPGRILFGDFLLCDQEKVTRALDARGKAKGRASKLRQHSPNGIPAVWMPAIRRHDGQKAKRASALLAISGMKVVSLHLLAKFPHKRFPEHPSGRNESGRSV